MANENIVLLRHLKQSALRCAAMVTSKISELTDAWSEDLAELDDAKQDVLTFDTTPTAGSMNPVTSDGVKTYVTQVVGGITGQSNVMVPDLSTEKVYRLHVIRGKLIMSENTSDGDADSITTLVLVDRLTNKSYNLYVANGTLVMEETTDTSGDTLDNVMLMDKLTNETYSLYVMDGKLMMEKSEG